jgi:hypothetical protein
MPESTRVWWLGFAAAVATAMLASVFAYDGMIPSWLGENPVDKVLHCTGAATLAFFLDGGLARRRFFRTRVPLASVLLLVPIGIEEYCQRFSEHRSSSLGDFAADVVGVALGILVSRRVAAILASKVGPGAEGCAKADAPLA